MNPVPIKFVDHVISWADDAVWEDGRQYRKDLAPGSASWIGNYTGDNAHAVLDFVCPCGCGTVHAITVRQGDKIEHSWQWDGNVEQPTLSPSIQCTTPCRWHGFLQKGIFNPC